MGEEKTPDEAPRKQGEAQWRADRDAVEQRNAAAKRRAREEPGISVNATLAGERRMEIAEAEQLRKLNKRLGQSQNK